MHIFFSLFIKRTVGAIEDIVKGVYVSSGWPDPERGTGLVLLCSALPRLLFQLLDLSISSSPSLADYSV